MSISQNFPNTRPSLNLNFARSKTLDPRITFTRTSTATYVDESGVIRNAVADEPRFDHDPVTGECLGLLIEEQRGNLFLYSSKHDESTWWINQNSSETINTTATSSPDGTNNATKLFGTNGATTRQSIYQSVSVTSGVTYTFSVFLKQGERRYATIWFDSPNVTEGAFWGASSIIDLQTGALATGTQTKIVPYPNGWYRCYVTATPNATQTMAMNLSVGSPNNDVAGYIANGDGSSGIYIWGHQVEQGSFPTSYVPTSGSTATRTPDNAKMEGSNFSSWYNPSEGSIFMEYQINSLTQFIPTVTGNSTHYIFMDDLSTEQSTFNKIQQFSSITSTQNRLQVDGTSYSPAAFSPPQEKTTNICGMAYKLGTSQVAAYSNNNISFTTAPSMPNNLSQLRLGASNDPIDRLNGTISYFTYYPARLPNATLQTLTK